MPPRDDEQQNANAAWMRLKRAPTGTQCLARYSRARPANPMDQSDDGQRRAAEQVGDTTRGQKSTTPLRLIATPAAAPRGRYPAEH